MSRKRNYADLLGAGNNAQIEKLLENEHKGGFTGQDLIQLFLLLQEEVLELTREMVLEFYDPRSIRREAADIANFAHMIILECDREIADE